MFKGLSIEQVYVVTNSKIKRMFGGVGSLGQRSCAKQTTGCPFGAFFQDAL